MIHPVIGQEIEISCPFYLELIQEKRDRLDVLLGEMKSDLDELMVAVEKEGSETVGEEKTHPMQNSRKERRTWKRR